MSSLGKGTPQGVRVDGMGLLPLQDPPSAPDGARGVEVYAKQCASCHKDDGQGERSASPGVGYSIPPLWGDDSFNAAAGMAKPAYPPPMSAPICLSPFVTRIRC